EGRLLLRPGRADDCLPFSLKALAMPCQPCGHVPAGGGNRGGARGRPAAKRWRDPTGPTGGGGAGPASRGGPAARPAPRSARPAGSAAGPAAPPRPAASAAGEGHQVLALGEGYTLLRRLGSGQFGEVYRALAPGGVEVAVKRIFRSVDDESSRRELHALEL